MKLIGLPRAVILAVFLGIIGFTVVGYNAFRKDVAAMQAASLEDITWTSYQLEQELGRFRNALNRFQIDNSGVDADDVNTRFDILWSRIAVFQQGRVGERLAEYDRETQIINRLFAYMKSVDRQIVSLRDGDKSTVEEFQLQLAPFANELREFSRDVTLGEETRGREIREQLQAGVNRTLQLGALAILIALASLLYINRESMRFKRLAEVNRKLAVAAEKASRAKSQFLTMMSHELRTPMNGVLGLLALTKRGATRNSQIRLIEQAEVSGQKMVKMLADVLDFSALASDDLKIEAKPFSTSRLVGAIHDEILPSAGREGKSFEVIASADCPTRISGDYNRLQQAIGHLTQYIVETAGVHDANLEISFCDDKLVATLTLEYLSDGDDWKPDLILGGEKRNANSFASDALGPAIARGIIEKMQGSICVENTEANKIDIIVSVPAEAIESQTINAKVLSNSETLAAICRTALSDGEIHFPIDDDSNIQILMIEAGGECEDDFIASGKRQFPNATLVALGEPINAEIFDFSVSLPLDFHQLRKFVLINIA